MSGLTPCRLQSKTLLTIDECGSKIARNSVGRQMTIKNSVSIDFWSLFYDKIDVFDCRLPGVGLIWIKTVWHSDGISVVVVVVVNKNTTYIIFLNKTLNRNPEFVDVVIRIVWVYAWRPKQHFLIMSGCSLGLVSPYTKQVIKCLAQGHNTVPLWMLNQRPDDLNIGWRGSSII